MFYLFSYLCLGYYINLWKTLFGLKFKLMQRLWQAAKKDIGDFIKACLQYIKVWTFI